MGPIESYVIVLSAWACGGPSVTNGGGNALPLTLDTARSTSGSPSTTAPRASPWVSLPAAGDV
eukprot:8351873-Pyramimonas_sp.AAC.1